MKTYTANAISSKFIISFIDTKKTENSGTIHVTGIACGNYKPTFQYDNNYKDIYDSKDIIRRELILISESMNINFDDFKITYNFD